VLFSEAVAILYIQAMKTTAVAVALATVLATAASGATPPDRVAFVAASYDRIALLSSRGEGLRRFGPGESPAFSTDASRIAFIRRGDVWVMSSDGTGLVQVTRTEAIEESPDWGPDGTLVYASNRSGSFTLWLQKPGAPARRLTRVPERWQEDRSPQWSPDGRSIAFASTRPGAFNQELYLVKPDGSGLRRLTRTPGSEDVLGDDGMPAWRPDGSGLVFVSNRDRNGELYALDLRSGRTTRLTRTPDVSEALPRVGRDGRYVFVVPVGTNGSRLSVMNAQLRGRTVLQAGTAIDPRP
jgi:Tol biopolymer transport system component